MAIIGGTLFSDTAKCPLATNQIVYCWQFMQVVGIQQANHDSPLKATESSPCDSGDAWEWLQLSSGSLLRHYGKDSLLIGKS
jgi:hypothetical protein